MPITKQDLDNITPEEKVLVQTELKFKTQAEIDAAYGKGMAAGKDEVQKELDTVKAQKTKLETELNTSKNKIAIDEKFAELKLTVTPEHKAKIIELINGDAEKIAGIAELMAPQRAQEDDPFGSNGAGSKNNKDPKPTSDEKDEDGNFKDPILQKMQNK